MYKGEGDGERKQETEKKILGGRMSDCQSNKWKADPFIPTK